MWQRAQKSSRSEPEPEVVCVVVPILKVDVQLALAQSPSVAVRREMRRKAPRQPGSRQELDIIDPFHSSKIRPWQVSQTPGLLAPFQSASNGGGWNWASAVSYGAGSGMRLGSCPCRAWACQATARAPAASAATATFLIPLCMSDSFPRQRSTAHGRAWDETGPAGARQGAVGRSGWVCRAL